MLKRYLIQPRVGVGWICQVFLQKLLKSKEGTAKMLQKAGVKRYFGVLKKSGNSGCLSFWEDSLEERWWQNWKK